MRSGRQDTGRQYIPRKPVTIGWEPDLPAIRRGVVLDPFTGTGTTGVVALKLGRHFVGIELYDNYAVIAEERCQLAYLLRSKYEAEMPSALDAENQLLVPNNKNDEVSCEVEIAKGAAC